MSSGEEANSGSSVESAVDSTELVIGSISPFSPPTQHQAALHLAKMAVSFTLPEKMEEAITEDIRLTVAYRGVLEAEKLKREGEASNSNAQANLANEKARELKIKNDFETSIQGKRRISYTMAFCIGIVLTILALCVMARELISNFSIQTVTSLYPAVLILIIGIGLIRAEAIKDSILDLIKAVKG